ncbi:MAG: sensor histidine kinase N-terminal domain-containing protein [Candidatus Dactylopiibacterium sp.]|nr:sensor histidine kinase N-terminal domain-containing protein [Candidatus Dactylopiibacterium sp.]
MPILPRRGLRRRLALILAPSLLALLLMSAAAQYLLTVRPMQREMDHRLADVAIALAERLGVDGAGRAVFSLPEAAAELLGADATDSNWYAAFDERFVPIAGETALRWPTAAFARGRPHFFDTTLGATRVRAVAVKTRCGDRECGVVTASTLHKRASLIRAVLISTLLPVALAGLLALALLWFGLGSGLRPLVRLSAEVERRSSRDLSPIRVEDAPGEVQPLVAAVNRLMAQLGEAGSAQQKFLSTAAHQLRTPLAGLQSRIELALLETHEPEGRARLADIHESAVRAARLAVQLLSLARAEPGASTADPRVPLDLARLATELVDEWVPRAIARRIDLGFELESAPVLGQPLLLRELMVNLLHNALEYTPPGGRVTLRCGREGGCSVLAVEDNGPGIAPALREKALQRFVRLPGTPGAGSGLGLAIVSEIAEGHQAVLQLREAPGPHGLLAHVAFPAA